MKGKKEKKIRKQTVVWTTRDKVKIRVCDMSDSHLQNTIDLLERRAKSKLSNLINFYICCPQPNGEMAQDAFDGEFDRLMDANWAVFLPEIYENLKLEQERRTKNERA
jgi:hypothetical protein